ncbi:histidine kinase [Microbacterium sp. WCS2018Hpa-23]|uniref:ATP-binding protein n=1 Tax=Microbacterium sp. WCS2018Hpa-23 TaxID=3073634 RepID=UPI00288320B4|nr:histidine kinase [Microbacterium sp. WCS2018Hpa-23]
MTGDGRWVSTLRDALVGIMLIAVLWLTAETPDTASRVLQLSLATIVLMAMLLRRKWPALTVAVSLLATCLAWTLGMTFDPFVLTGWCVLVYSERRNVQMMPWWMVASGAALLLVALGFRAEGVEDRLRDLLLGAIVLSAAWFLGVRTREARSDAALRSRTEERLRLARDVHDVLSHSLGAIGVHAGVSAHVTTLDEDELREALRHIEMDARRSLAELKTLLHHERSSVEGSLALAAVSEQSSSGPPNVPERRSERVPSGATAAALSSPFSASLTDVVSAAQRAGIHTAFDAPIGVELDGLPAHVHTTLYRVAQEATTNVIRHSSASSMSIRVKVLAASVELEVRDDGTGSPARGVSKLREGHGLTGMRERVALVGGTLRIASDAAAPQPGFVVTATIPLSPEVVRQ